MSSGYLPSKAGLSADLRSLVVLHAFPYSPLAVQPGPVPHRREESMSELAACALNVS